MASLLRLTSDPCPDTGCTWRSGSVGPGRDSWWVPEALPSLTWEAPTELARCSLPGHRPNGLQAHPGLIWQGLSRGLASGKFLGTGSCWIHEGQLQRKAPRGPAPDRDGRALLEKTKGRSAQDEGQTFSAEKGGVRQKLEPRAELTGGSWPPALGAPVVASGSYLCRHPSIPPGISGERCRLWCPCPAGNLGFSSALSSPFL